MICPSCSAEVAPRATFCAGCGARVPDALIDSTIDGRYRVEKKIATGGFGAIYRATQITNGRQVAIKVMHGDLAADENLVSRFRREGVVLCNLRDAHTVTTYELGALPDGRQFIVMELLEGKTLLEVFRSEGPLEWPRMLAIARAICSALAEAHALGIVHRDLKPPNIFLETARRDFVKVLDFGIAKIMHGSGINDQSDLTAMGQAVGTLEYMAPEQLMGGKCDGRTDIYTLGVVMFEMLTGRRPFADAMGLDLLTVQLSQEAPLVSSRAQVPPEVDQIVARCLAPDADERFRDVTELSEVLDAVLDTVKRRDSTPLPRPPSPVPAPPVTRPRPPSIGGDDGMDSNDTVLDGHLDTMPSMPVAEPPPDGDTAEFRAPAPPHPEHASHAQRPQPPQPQPFAPAPPSPPPPPHGMHHPIAPVPTAQVAPVPFEHPAPRRQLHPALVLLLLCLVGVLIGAAIALWV